SEAYAQIFGYPAREWGFPPLNTLARIYALGIEQGARTQDLLLRSPLRVEADGSFRLNAPLRDGTDVYLMVGSPDACLSAACNAATQAKAALNGLKPVFGLVLVDTAWQTLLQSTPGAEIAAIRDALANDIPLAGGYTLGQFVPGIASGDSPRFMNQNLLVILFGTSE
ncbi:MAG: FIST C-terminal domain-containing protein, partial [Anaerolineales bacterium]